MTLTVGQMYDRAVLHGGDAVAISQQGRQLSYRALGEQAARLSGALTALGVGRLDRVAFLMVNCPEYVACEYAVAQIGATRVPLAVLLADDDLASMVQQARCKVLVYHHKLSERVRRMQPRLDSVQHYICVADDGQQVAPDHLDLGALLAAQPPTWVRAEVDPEDIAGIYFTGGTTGKSKGVMLSHRAWFHTCWMEMLDFDIVPREVMVLATPVTHAAGCMILPVLLRQGRCVLLDHFEPELLLSTIAAERASATMLVPSMIYALLDHPRRDAHDLTSLRNILYGASAIAPERLKQALQVFGPKFTQFFGQTEAPMALLALQRADHLVEDPARELAVLTSAGRATYPTRIRLVDDAGNDVAAGESGELIAQAPNMMSGYLDNPQATEQTIGDGWLHTGDIARMDASGLFTIVDRKKDMIVSGGFNVYPREVEDALFEHPAVKQAAVIGVPHEKWGEEVKALVVLREGQTTSAQELIDFVKSRKGSLVAPKSVDFVAAVPLTNLGKPDKKAMRAPYWSTRGRSV